MPRVFRFAVWFGLLSTLSTLLFNESRAQDGKVASTPASEAKPSEPAVGHSLHGEAFDDGPRRRASLLPGMGRVSFPISTVSTESQKFLDQGVAQLHSFFYFEAERSFRQAALLDPGCPMALWGMTMANVNNPKRASGFLREARTKSLARKLSRREQLYLDALEARYRAGVDDKESKKAYLLALETIVEEFPEDLDARAWMAMVTWENASSNGIGSRQAIDMVLESILAQEPLHPGALHYQIHLWDHQKPRRAERAAALYASAAPGIAHAWHMPAHTYTELKQYSQAAYQQEGSARVDHASMTRDRTMPWETHNYAHNNQWLATSLAHLGRAKEAIEVARNLVDQPRDPQKNAANDGGSAGRSGRLRWSEVLVKFELWDALIDATSSQSLDWSDEPAEKVERAYTFGLASAGLKNQASLDTQVEALRGMLQGQKGKDQEKEKELATLVAGPLAELEGHQYWLRGDVAAAFEQFAKASRIRPEALARAHLAARNFGLAESLAKSAVAKQPNQVAPLAAEVEVLAGSGKTDEAKAAYRDLRKLASESDHDLPVLARLASIVAGWNDPDLAKPVATDPEPDRLPLEPLGPLTWKPFPAESLASADTEGTPWSLADHKGRNVLVLFYLGGKCPHCMQQLQEFGKQFAAFRDLGTDVVAVGTDPIELARELKHNSQGVNFPMPILPDPDFAAFKAYGVFDDFEGMPLHGTFLIDGRGDVRFQKISAEPFLDVEFLKGEAARVNRLTRPPEPGHAAHLGIQPKAS